MKKLLSLLVLTALLVSPSALAWDEETSIYQTGAFLINFPQTWDAYETEDSYLFRGPENEIITIVTSSLDTDKIDKIGGAPSLYGVFYEQLGLRTYDTAQFAIYDCPGDLWYGYAQDGTPMYGLIWLYKADFICISVMSSEDVGFNLDILNELQNSVLPAEKVDLSKLAG